MDISNLISTLNKIGVKHLGIQIIINLTLLYLFLKLIKMVNTLTDTVNKSNEAITRHIELSQLQKENIHKDLKIHEQRIQNLENKKNNL